MHVWVTDGPPPATAGGIVVEGNGVRIRNGDDDSSTFDHTHFGTVPDGQPIERTFELFNRGDSDLICSDDTVSINGKHAADFRVVHAPRQLIESDGYGRFVIQFRPRATGAQASGTRAAEVAICVADTSIRFAVTGESTPQR